MDCKTPTIKKRAKFGKTPKPDKRAKENKTPII